MLPLRRRPDTTPKSTAAQPIRALTADPAKLPEHASVVRRADDQTAAEAIQPMPGTSIAPLGISNGFDVFSRVVQPRQIVFDHPSGNPIELLTSAAVR
jgi:hypothetical protein